MTEDSKAKIKASALALAAKGITPDTVAMSSETATAHSIHGTHTAVMDGDPEIEHYTLEIEIRPGLALHKFAVSGSRQTVSADEIEADATPAPSTTPVKGA